MFKKIIMPIFCRVFRVSRDNHGGRSGRSFLNDDIEMSGDVNGPSHKLERSNSVGGNNNNSAEPIPLEICFHVKEAWNIFEVSLFWCISKPPIVNRMRRIERICIACIN